MRAIILVVLLAGCADGGRSISNCPVTIGDKVEFQGHRGEVRTIYSTGSLTRNCHVGVLWDDGEATDIEGWKLSKYVLPAPHETLDPGTPTAIMFDTW